MDDLTVYRRQHLAPWSRKRGVRLLEAHGRDVSRRSQLQAERRACRTDRWHHRAALLEGAARVRRLYARYLNGDLKPSREQMYTSLGGEYWFREKHERAIRAARETTLKIPRLP